MSKALDKAQADLDAFKAEIEAWMATQPPADVAAARAAALRPARKPAAKRTRAQLIESATTAPAAPTEDVDTSWVELEVSSPAPATQSPKVLSTPLFVHPREYMELTYTAIPTAAPVPVPAAPKSLRKRMAAAYLDGYRNP